MNSFEDPLNIHYELTNRANSLNLNKPEILK